MAIMDTFAVLEWRSASGHHAELAEVESEPALAPETKRAQEHLVEATKRI
jgi:hypothetical protein